MNKVILSIVTFLFIFSCQKSKEVSKIVGNDWLLGKWENKSKAGNLLEIWTKANDSLFVGESYFIKGKDTLHFEKIELKQKRGSLYYISTIKGQNNNKPVTFGHNLEIEKQLVFENPTTEYPRKIVYKPLSKNRLFIEISGIEQKKPSSVGYSMQKTK